MLYTLVLTSLLGQASAPVVVPEPPQAEVVKHDVLAPIDVIPSRSLRKNILSAELGWNGLAPVGVMYSRNLSPYFSLDAAAGIAARGGQFGLRGRWNFLKTNLTPFLGLGVMYGTGWPDNLDRHVHDSDVVKYSFKVDRSPLAQGVLGLSWQTRKGFSLMGMMGWTQLLRNNNVIIKSGVARKSEQDLLKIVYGSGPTVALNIGYAF